MHPSARGPDSRSFGSVRTACWSAPSPRLKGQLGACFRLGTDKEGKDVLEPLQPLQRSVLRLTVLEGVSMLKAADWLGVAPATVQRARRQGLAGLRKGLKAQSHQSDSAP